MTNFILKNIFLIYIVFFSFFSNTQSIHAQSDAPHIAFSFDDGITGDVLNYSNDAWNSMIREHLAKYNIKAIWFVRSKGMDNPQGIGLVYKWEEAGHLIGNHTYNHRNLSSKNLFVDEYIEDIKKCNDFLYQFKNYRKIFRYPYLKTGNTVAKRDSVRKFLLDNGFKQGWVTIDASDWYINSRLIERLKQNLKADISGYRKYFVNHIFDRANYYNDLSLKINKRQIHHTLLLHLNLTSALFLSDLIEKFKSEGWIIDDYEIAIKDLIYNELPIAMPSEQSLIWLQALETGKYDKILRYPGEDGEYERENMDKLGL